MFRKKECKKCKNKVSGKFEFCPYCGNPMEYEKEDFGMLGKNDLPDMNDNIKLPFGFNTIFNSLVNSLNKEMNELSKVEKKSVNPKKDIMKNGISINISSSGDTPPKVTVSYFGDGKKTSQKTKKIKEAESRFFSEEKTKQFLKLPKEEPSTNIRRLSGKVIYEIEMKDVSSADDISIIKLENSVEIRAIAKKKAYFKIIPINLPMVNYEFLEGRLVLELKD